MNYKEEIKKLEKEIDYTKEQIELDKKYEKEGVWKLEDAIKPRQILIELFEKFDSLPGNALDIPCQTIGFYIDYDNGRRLKVYPCFKNDIFGGLYTYICDSSSEWYIQMNKYIESTLYNICEIPSFTIMRDSGYFYECEYLSRGSADFYNEVLKFIEFFNKDKVAKAILKSIDAYYLGIVEAAKNEFE